MELSDNIILIIIVTSVATFISRFLGVLTAEKINEKWIEKAKEWAERARLEGGLKIALPVGFGQHSGLDPAGTAMKKVFQGHTKRITCVSFSPGGKSVCTGSDGTPLFFYCIFLTKNKQDKTAIIWDAVSGKELKKLKGHDDIICSVSFSPDGSWICTGSEGMSFSKTQNKATDHFSRQDCTIRVWNPVTGEAVNVLEGHSDGVRPVHFSQDGKRICSGSIGLFCFSSF